MTTCLFWSGACCWHSLRPRCVPSRADRHSLVTQGELLISKERDVLVTAPGSLEDKQSPIISVTVARQERWIDEFSFFLFFFFQGATLASPHSRTRNISAVKRVHASSCGGCVRGASPTYEPSDTSAHTGRSHENSHVM